MVENPEPIQDVDLARDRTNIRSRVPLFLIHDGGGTTYAYHCLDPIRRPTYGIFNPRYHSGGSFEGGVPGMSRLYAFMIKQTCAQPNFPGKRNPDKTVDILIGGWSMGGLLSLEIAKVLTGDPDVRVIGVLMMESMCPVNLPKTEGYMETLNHLDHAKSNIDKSDRNIALSIRAMQEALRVIREWQPPVWAGKEAKLRPRFSLLRAVDPLVLGGKRAHILDIYRDDRKLGWDKYDPDLFTETMDVKGNHFEMFGFQHIPCISKAIKSSCDTLEKLGRS